MENLKAGFEFIFSSYKRTAAILFIGALTLAIPITITLVGQQQDIRQRASTSDNVISGTVFLDNNGNGVQDSGETDYSGAATIKLENGTTATKYGNGFYFTGVASGTHTVTLTEPSGYIKTTPTYVSVTVPPNDTFKFGIKSSTAPTPTRIPTPTPTPTPTNAPTEEAILNVQSQPPTGISISGSLAGTSGN